jgi:hypothetical protein
MIRFSIAKINFLLLSIALSYTCVNAQVKPLQLSTNAPLFIVEGDHLLFPCLLKNNTTADITGTITFSITNKADNENIDGWFQNSVANQYFTANAKSTESAYFPIDIPFQFTEAINWKIKLQTSTFSDSVTGTMLIRKNTEAIDSIKSSEIVKTFYKKSAGNNQWIKLNEWDEITASDLIKLSVGYTLKLNYPKLLLKNISYAGLTDVSQNENSGYIKNSIELTAKESTIGTHTYSIILKPTQKGKFNCGLTELIDATTNKRIGKGNSVAININ